MYCPQCATPHVDGVKFCRSCGIELETVALMLSGMPVQPAEAGGNKTDPKSSQDWLEKHGEGVRGITTGASLLAVSLLIGVAMALFIPVTFDAPWILVWLVLVGWMAVWGGIELGSGIGDVLVSKNRLRLLGLSGKELAIDLTAQQLLPAAEPPTRTSSSTAFRPPTSPSVTEGTTRQLKDSVER